MVLGTRWVNGVPLPLDVVFKPLAMLCSVPALQVLQNVPVAEWAMTPPVHVTVLARAIAAALRGARINEDGSDSPCVVEAGDIAKLAEL